MTLTPRSILLITVLTNLFLSSNVHGWMGIHPNRKRTTAILAIKSSTNGEDSMKRRDVFGRAIATVVSSGFLQIVGGGALPASAVQNPLNLKGSFWETGELYQKPERSDSMDPEDLFTYLVQTAKTLKQLTDVATDGKFGDLTRLLRGGAVSESQIRLKAYALIDQIDEDDEKDEFLASELLRLFLQRLDRLDRTVEAASRQSKLDGGAMETLGLAVVSPFGAANELSRIANEPNFGSDSRIQVIADLEDTAKALEDFNKVIERTVIKKN